MTTAATSSADQTVDPHILPNFYDSAVPNNLKPSLSFASRDYPKPYLDGCHTQQNMPSNANSCTYGNKTSKTTIVLFGDSHALSWFPAIEKLAITNKFRFVSLTMSSCWPSNIPAWNSTTNLLMENCSTWRQSAFKRIKSLKPKYVFVAGTDGFATVDENGNQLTGDDRKSAWLVGMNDTLSQIKATSGTVFYLADYPVAVPDPVNCLKKSKKVGKCVKALNKALSFDWLQTEHDVAISNGAIFIDGTEWICQTDPCAPISGNYLIYRDAGHLTATFASTLYSPLYRAIKKYLV